MLGAPLMLTGLAEALEQVQAQHAEDATWQAQCHVAQEDAAKEESVLARAGWAERQSGGGEGKGRPHEGATVQARGRRKRHSFAEEALRINEKRRKSLLADLAVVGVEGVRRRRRNSETQPIGHWRPEAVRELALIPGLFPE